MKNNKDDVRNEFLREQWPLLELIKFMKNAHQFDAIVCGVPAKFIGVDYGSKPDVTVVSSPCGNCGVYRRIDNGVMEKCPYCGDDETDLNEETGP